MNFISDVSPYMIILGILIILLIIIGYFGPALSTKMYYRKLPAEYRENCAVCGRHTPHGKKIMFYKGGWVTHHVNPMKPDKDYPSIYEYKTLELEKRIFLVVCNTCKNKERLKEFLSTLTSLFTNTMGLFIITVIVVLMFFLLNTIMPEIFFGHYYLIIKVITIIALISISLRTIVSILDLLRIIFNSKSYQKKLETGIILAALKEEGRSLYAADDIER
ncbi:MAG: hypothetical protein Q8L68_01315 [Methylococcales bacterium]|nr:hypothetical protein [Methylococcales bacterium]